MRTCLLLAFFAAVSQLAAQQHAGSETPADVETGSRIYGLHCSPCHGANGNLIAAADLLRGQFRHGSSDEDLKRVITQGIPGTAMPSNQFNSSELTAVVAYLRSMRDYESRAIQVGDARRGRQLFESSGGCLTCHRVNGNGSRLAPDLSEIGAIRSAAALQRAVLDPGGSRLPQHRFVRVVTQDGTQLSGRRLNEDTFTIQLIDDHERLVSLPKAGLREYTVVRTSAMPSYKGKYSSRELADLVAYLVSLKGSN